MKVLILSCLYSPYIGGGAEVIIEEHAKALLADGIEVAILSTGPGKGLVQEEVDGVRVWRAGIRNLYHPHGATRPNSVKRMLWHLLDMYNPLMKGYLAEVIRIEKPDVASCHNITGWSISAWDSLTAAGIPIVQVLHDQYLLCARSTMFNRGEICKQRCLPCRLMRLFHPKRSNQVAAVVGVSRFILERTLSYGNFRNTPIKVSIPNARSFPEEPTGQARRGRDGTVQFGFIGSLAPNKGIELLLQTFRRFAPENWRLLVAGTGKSEYQSMLKTRYQDQRISFLGHCRPQSFFSKLDVTIVPSLWEDTLPGVVFESMLFGIPVIGSRRGGIPEMVSEGVTGLLFDPEEPDSLLRAMSQAAEEIASGQYSRDVIMQQAEAFKDQKEWTRRWVELYQTVQTSAQRRR